MGDCIVPGCGRDGRNNLGIRLRRPDTSALWAPNTEAFVCDRHAVSGARITIFYEGNDTAEVEIRVHGASAAVSRVTPIRQEAARDVADLTDDLRLSRDSGTRRT
jgi:hypothetical protein